MSEPIKPSTTPAAAASPATPKRMAATPRPVPNAVPGTAIVNGKPIRWLDKSKAKPQAE